MTESATDDLADAIPNINLGEMLVRAVVQSFFQPQLVGVSEQPPAYTGAPTTFAPQYGTAPMQQLVHRLASQYGDRIRDAVINGVDLDALTDKVAGAVTERIVRELDTAEPTPRYGHRTAAVVSAEAINTEVRKKVAERLSEREMAAYDARQAEMQAAWERDQQRQRDQLAIETRTPEDPTTD